MNARTRTVMVSLLMISLGILQTLGAQTAGKENLPSRRIGLFVGANQGGPGRAPLMWAIRDSQRMSEVMKELGGMAGKDVYFLPDPDTTEFNATLGRIARTLDDERSGSQRMEFMFYYSGHSNDQGLLLKDGMVPYQDIRDALKESKADVAIAILDSCSSGSFTRTKGGSRTKPFLYDDSINMKGYAFITSSSADEAAQESDNLKASFFTHYMISGLRGAADRNQDGRVNLNEAYEFAFQETLASTGSSRSGPQHPSYDIQLKGSGDLVLSDLSQPSASLVLGAELDGRIFIRDESQVLVIELGKQKGKTFGLALQPGTYTIRLESAAGSFEAKIKLGSGKTVGVSFTEFKEMPRIANRNRGDENPAAPEGSTPAGTQQAATTDQAAATPAPQASARPASSETPAQAAAHRDLGEAAADFDQAAREFMDSVTTTVLDTARSAFFGKDKAPEATPAPDAQAGTSPSPAKDASLATEGEPGDGSTEGEATEKTPLYPFNLSFVPGLSIFPDGANSDSIISLGVLVNQSRDSLAFMAAGMGSIVNHETTGVLAAGMWTSTGSLAGLQSSGIFNTSAGETLGVQAAGVFNTSGGTVQGVQSAGVFNTANKAVEGVQAAGIFNTAGGNVTGAQVAGIWNSGSNIAGFQSAGLFNTARDMAGFQVAGLFNSADKVSGVQAAGLFNVSDSFEGLQAAGLFNVTGEGKGIQAGIINIGDKLEGLPVGIINIYKQGIHDLSYWYGVNDRHWAGLFSGNDTFYSGIFAGLGQDSGLVDLQGLAAGVATGFRLHADVFFVDLNINAVRYTTGTDATTRIANFFLPEASGVVPGMKLQAGLDLGFVILSAGLELKTFFPGLAHEADYFSLDPASYAGVSFPGNPWIESLRLVPLLSASFSI